MIDWDMEDRLYMEQSTLREFVDETQLKILRAMWKAAHANK